MGNPSSKKIITVVLVTGITIMSMGYSSFASSNHRLDPEQSHKFSLISPKSKVDKNCESPQKYFEAILNDMVKEGTLSQEKMDAIKSYINSNIENRKDNKKGHHNGRHFNKGIGLLDDLKAKNIITDQEKTNIEAKFKSVGEGKLKEFLRDLVDKGILPKEKVEKVHSYLQKEMEAGKAGLEKLKSMTDEERKEHFKEMKKVRVNVFDKMVKDGILTQEEADNIKGYLSKHHKR